MALKYEMQLEPENGGCWGQAGLSSRILVEKPLSWMSLQENVKEEPVFTCSLVVKGAGNALFV